MNLSKKTELALLLFYCKLFKKRRPLLVSWYITHKCNLRCKYCDVPSFKSGEVSTKNAFRIIDELAECGCKGINFTGGEPLLREDIGELVDYAKSKGIYVVINSNGLLARKKINQIKNADILQLSFDGPREIHDMQRGKGSYNKVIQALEAARKKGIKTAVSVTLTRHNINHIGDIIDFVNKERILVHFQPVASILGPKSYKKLEIPRKDYVKAVDTIKKAKQRCKFIVNTSTGLEYLKKEKREIINCGAFRINCVIAPNGDLYPCNGFYQRIKPHNCIELGFKEAFMKSQPIKCNSCICTKTLDLDLVYDRMLSFDFDAIKDIINSALK